MKYVYLYFITLILSLVFVVVAFSGGGDYSDEYMMQQTAIQRDIRMMPRAYTKKAIVDKVREAPLPDPEKQKLIEELEEYRKKEKKADVLRDMLIAVIDKFGSGTVTLLILAGLLFTFKGQIRKRVRDYLGLPKEHKK